MLIDNHHRPITYLRLAVTDRCNLRCTYCMPEEGLKYLPKQHLMSYEEMLRMVSLMSDLGINKIRITGGEPFLRKDIMYFLKHLREIPGIQKISITSNGTLLGDYLDQLAELDITHINLSIDSLDKERFKEITRRDELETVLDCMKEMIKRNFHLKLNAVVMKNRNIEDIIPLAELARVHPIEVRYIEEMPFNGDLQQKNDGFWSYLDLEKYLFDQYPKMNKQPIAKGNTAMEYRIPGFKGTIGIIAAYSRTFCGSCNRIRVTPTGVMKTCLYDKGVFDIKKLMRSGASNAELAMAIKQAVGHRAKDGFEAEKNRFDNFRIGESMASIGG